MSQRLVVLVPNEKNTLRHVLFLCYDFKTNTQTHTHTFYTALSVLTNGREIDRVVLVT